MCHTYGMDLPQVWQFVRFCAVGTAGLLVNLGVTYLGVTFGLWYMWAYVIGLLVSWSVSFGLNALFTFPEHTRGRYAQKYAFFIGNYALMFGLNGTIVYILTSLMGVFYLISIILSAFITTAISYTVSKKFIYR